MSHYRNSAEIPIILVGTQGELIKNTIDTYRIAPNKINIDVLVDVVPCVQAMEHYSRKKLAQVNEIKGVALEWILISSLFSMTCVKNDLNDILYEESFLIHPHVHSWWCELWIANASHNQYSL